MDPIKLLDYPAEDVFELINGLIDYNCRNDKEGGRNNGGVIRRKAKDDWF